MRITFATIALLGFAGVSVAEELDREAPTTQKAATEIVTSASTGSELDQESPQAAHCWRGGWGYGGYPAFGYSYSYASFSPAYYAPAFYGPAYYPGFASYRSFGYVGFGGGFYGYRGFGPRYGYWW